MVKKNQKQNPMLINLIHELKKQSNQKNKIIWKDIALRLEKPARNWPVVNLDHISKYTQEKETALIPGKVLSDGQLTKKINIAAWSFSQKAIEKIKQSGGKTMTITELMKNNPEGKNIRILG